MTDDRNKIKILIVDDSRIDLNILESILTQLNFSDIIKSQNGREALRLAEKHRPDLIITDIMMPEVDGGKFRELLKESPITNHIPVIFISAAITPQEVSAHGGLLASGDILIAKPYAKNKIAEAIHLSLK